MDVRGKLVELLAPTSLNFEEAAYLADYLVKNGVTVQEWISVKDRLPEEDGEYLVWFGNSILDQYAEVRGFAKDGDTVDKYDLHNEKNVWFHNDSEWGYFACRNVTHWMPLPSTEGLK